MPKQPRTFLELWGWREFMDAAERTDTGLRYMAREYDDFPVPVAELRQGPIFLASECREFLAAHPKAGLGNPVADDVLRRVYAMRDAGIAPTVIARETGLSRATVYRRLAERRRG